MDPKAFRLPTTVRPTRYDVDVTLDPEDPMYPGTVRIALEVASATDEVVLHSRDTIIRGAAVEQEGRHLEAEPTLDEDRETLTLRLPEALGPGDAVLHIEFTGKVARDMAGLYLAEDGDERCLVTQCEATDARAVFPCFDEPAFKARIAWTVRAPAGLTVLANGPLASREDTANGRTTWRFEATAPIASYLAAVAVGAFGATEAIEVGEVPFRVWALDGKEKHGGHANAFAAELLPWYEETFDVPYHFGKYDQVAVPAFSFGAMENVGLVVFRPSLLLLDDATSSWRQRKRVDLVVAHEFAHMWFGNLVTMQWWDDLWLNEAFAEWIANEAVAALVPDHDIWFEFQAGTARAFETDALGSTHPIYNEVSTPAEATEMFDVITYQKGSTVLRMLDAYLGRDAVRRGLSTYMRDLAEANATGADLWRHFQEASDEPVEQIMSCWVNTPGHPVVAMRLDEEGAPGLVPLQFAQTRARSSPLVEADDAVWDVPLVLRYEDDAGVHEARHLLTEREATLELPVEGELGWVHGNADDVGFYRCAPQGALRDRLASSFASLSPAERIGVLRDQWHLVRSGDQAPAEALDLFDQVLAGEDHYAVVDKAVELVEEIDRLLLAANDDAVTARWRGWVAERFRGALDGLGLEPAPGEDPRTRQRRASLLRALAVVAEDEAFVEAAIALADRELDEPSAVDANVAGLVVAVAARHGDAERFERHWAAFEARRESDQPPQVVDRALHSMVFFRRPALVERALDLVVGGKVPQQMVGPLLTAMLGEVHAQEATWTRVKASWSELRERLGEAWLGRLVEATGELPPGAREDVVSFLEAHLDGAAPESFRRARERLEERAELHARILPGVVSWVRDHR